MAKYSLQRGVRGSDARHIATTQHYRDLHVKNEELREDIVDIEYRKQEVNEKIRDMYDHRDEAKVKFLVMDEYNRQKESERSEKESRLEQLKEDYEPYQAQDDRNLLLAISPYLRENLRISKFRKGVGLTVKAIKTLFSGKPIQTLFIRIRPIIWRAGCQIGNLKGAKRAGRAEQVSPFSQRAEHPQLVQRAV